MGKRQGKREKEGKGKTLFALGDGGKMRKQKREREREGGKCWWSGERARGRGRACLGLLLARQASWPERKNLAGDHSWRLGC